jgi:hypothetical protein
VVGPRELEAGPSDADRRRVWAVRTILFIGAVGIAGLVAWRINLRLPLELDVSTDIVGYPIFANFNITHFFQTYVLIVAAFPTMALVIYAVGARVLSVRTRGPLRLTVPAAEPRQTPDVAGATLGCSLVVGAGFGIEIAIAAYPRTDSFWLVALGSTAVYVLLAHGVGWIVTRYRALSLDDAVSTVIAVSAPFALLGLYVLSRISSVAVITTQSVNHYPWLPLWVAIVATLLLLGLVVRSLSRRDGGGSARVARSTVLYLSTPLLLMLVLAQLPPALYAMDMFHDGEGLVAANLTLNGALPWRDLLSIHGLLDDVLREMIGLVVFENSRWGGLAGQQMLVLPLYWFLNYLLFVRLFRRSWIAIAATVLMTAAATQFGQGLFFHTHYRMLLAPVVLLVFARLLDRSTWPRAAAMAGTALLAFILTPEMAYLVGALAVTLVAFEWLHRGEGERWQQAFPRVARSAVCGIAGLTIFLVYLVATGSSTQYIGYFGTFAAGHELTGGIPIQWAEWEFDFAAYVTVGVVLVAVWYFVANLRARRTMSTNDWTMIGLAIAVALYYQKFLGRADAHVFHPWAMAIPLFYYEVYKVAAWISERLAARTWRTPSTRRLVVQLPFVGLLLFVIVLVSSYVVAQAESGPVRFRAVVPEPALIAREGYVEPGVSAFQTVTDLQRVLDAVMRPGDTLYDFTNEPGLFYYLLDYTPPTRFYHVSMAIPKRAQQELIDELEQSDPDIVVYDATRFGLPSWDGVPNAVRHYDISEYLLDHYEPFVAFDGYTLFAKPGRTIPRDRLVSLPLAPPSFENLAFPAHPCAWGYAPNFFSVEPAAGAQRTDPLVGAPVAGASSNAVRYLLPPDAQRYRWLELDSSRPFADDAFLLKDGNDPIDGDPARAITFQTLPRSGDRYRVMLSNCSQWRGFAGDSIVLTHDAEQGDISLRLVR